MRFLLFFVFLYLSSCSLINMDKKYFTENEGKPVQKEEMSFEKKQALAKGATINNSLSNKVYYEGSKAKSQELKTILDFSYEAMGMFGVNTDFDLNNLESLKKAQEDTRKAVEEKNRIISKLEQDVKDKEIEKKTIEESKKAELIANNGKWVAKLGAIWWWICFCVIFGLIGAFALQVYTGIPLFTGLFTGSIKTVGRAFRSTIKGVQEFKDELELKIKDEHLGEREKEHAKEILESLRSKLSSVHDLSVKKYIAKVKEKL